MFITKLENGEMYAGTKKQIIELAGKPGERKTTVWFQPMPGSDFFVGQIEGVFPDSPIPCRTDEESPMKECLEGKVKYIGKLKQPDFIKYETILASSQTS